MLFAVTWMDLHVGDKKNKRKQTRQGPQKKFDKLDAIRDDSGTSPREQFMS